MSYGIRHKPLTDEQRTEICGYCGHPRGRHNNPDTCCMVDGCECETFRLEFEHPPSVAEDAGYSGA